MCLSCIDPPSAAGLALIGLLLVALVVFGHLDD